MENVGVIIPAGGIGKRMGADRPKQFIEIDGTPVLIHTLKKFQSCERVHEIVIAAPIDYISSMEDLLARHSIPKVVKIVPGGKERQDSVYCGLKALSDSVSIVLVHDAVRPFVAMERINMVIDEVIRSGAALLAVPQSCTLKQVQDDMILSTIDRSALWQAQTPQGATRKLFEKAFINAEEHSIQGTDDVSLIEAIGHPVKIVRGDTHNIKITDPEDLLIAEALLKSEKI